MGSSKIRHSTRPGRSVRSSRHNDSTKSPDEKPRPLAAIEAEIARARECLAAGFRKADPGLQIGRGLQSLEQERNRHPETIVKALAGLRLGEDPRAATARADAPELGIVLREISNRLEFVAACAETIYDALDNGVAASSPAGCSAVALMRTLENSVLDPLGEEIKTLREAVSGARYQDGMMVVVKDELEAHEVQS